MTSSLPSPVVPARSLAVVLTLVALAVAVFGLLWAKGLSYADRVAGGAWKGGLLLGVGAGEDPVARAWTFTSTYTQAVWKALTVALVVAR